MESYENKQGSLALANRGLKVSKRRGGNGQQAAHEPAMRLETRVFGLCRGRYGNLTELARAMGISVCQVYRVRQGKRPISEKFITGTVKAFPGYSLDDLFRVVPGGKHYGGR